MRNRSLPAVFLLVLLALLILAGCTGGPVGDRGLTEPLTAPPPTPSPTNTPTAGPGTATPTTPTTTPTPTPTPTSTPKGPSPTPQPVPPTSPAQSDVPAPINEGETVTPAPGTATPGTPAPGTPAGGTPAASEGTFENPVIKDNFPDPFLLKADDGFWYGYATNLSLPKMLPAIKNIQVARSKDLIHWELLADALPVLPSWSTAAGSLVWAPEVAKLAQNYVMYYTARDKASNKQCVGVATSTKPAGKFKDTSDKPFVCQTQEGGTIDPDPFRDDNKMYLYFKNDGNCCGIPTYIFAQELSPDGMSLVGEPVRLIRNEGQWEGSVIEAPTMLKHAGKYYLFFSANNYAGLEYAVGYATCETPTGPCTQAPENPILKSQMEPPPNLVIGPGGQAIIHVGNQDWIAYHAWEVTSAGLRGDRRQMYLNRLDWQNGKPVVVGPLTGPQPAP